LLISSGYPQETLTITTFYPSPVGIYRTLILSPTDDFDPNSICDTEGQMFYDDSDNQIYVCDGSDWQPIGVVRQPM
jgi:hypothetical protein